ncbi:hypothetical protein ACP4OV_005747 [Aristida adscensionis]
MLREAGEVAGASETSKIRKRRAVSSSGASSEALRKLRLRARRGVRLIGRRRGGGTGAGASPCSSKSNCSSSSRSRTTMSESSPWNRRHCRLADVETRSTSSAASARKLVGSPWRQKKGAGAFEEEEEETELVGWDAAVARQRSDHHRRSASMELSKMSRRKSSKAMEGDGDKSWHNGHAHGHWFSDVMSNGGTTEVHALAQGLASPCPVDRPAQLQELYNSLTASSELVRVLANVLGPGGLNPTAASLIAALRSEIGAARARTRQLARQHRRHGGEDSAEHLRKQLLEEVRAWKSRQREKAAAAARVVASELDGERRSRRRAERVSKKLGEALAEAESSLRTATRELERERKARERLEKACDELAGGAGGAGAAESAAREELEREREMLLVADELREERVRMKLAEARLQFEEKNAVVDQLRHELEAFLHAAGKQDQEFPAADEHRVADDDHRLQLALASEFGVDGIDRVAVYKKSQGGGKDGGGDEGREDDDSEGSDIELNMDGNSWSYTTASKETTIKNAASVHGSLSDRGTESGAGAGDLDRRSDRTREAVEQDWEEDCSDDGTTTKDLDEDAERYEAIKNLREQMLAGHGFVFMSQGGADDERDRHSHGLINHIEQGRLW